jgi:hypothetical protein
MARGNDVLNQWPLVTYFVVDTASLPAPRHPPYINRAAAAQSPTMMGCWVDTEPQPSNCTRDPRPDQVIRDAR